jgi:hypothetical protein
VTRTARTSRREATRDIRGVMYLAAFFEALKLSPFENDINKHLHLSFKVLDCADLKHHCDPR